MTHRPPRAAPVRHAERRRVQSLDDRALVEAMREGDPWAWSEFAARARAVLEGAMPNDEANDASVGELLTLVGLHLARPDAPIPTRLAPYLVRAAVRYRRQRARNVRRRAAWHVRAVREDAALALPDAHDVAGSLFSEYARRAAGESVPARAASERAVRTLVARLLDELTPENVQLLTWTADGVPHREVAAWLGLSYAAVAKRVQRLTRRLATRAAELRPTLPADDQAALARLLREPSSAPGGPAPDRSHSLGTP